MSKANQKFVQSDEAVSPVIGVILMVAITVVLAAVVFVLVSNLSKGTGDAAPTMAWTTSSNNVTLVKADSGLNWTAFRATVTGSGCTASIPGNSTVLVDTATAGSGLVTAGNRMTVNRAAGGTCTLSLVHAPTNQLVFGPQNFVF